jgi:chemotaxis protein methyltransferase CheR
LLGDPRETLLASEVVEALLNNETYFFRDHAVFDHLAEQVLPKLAKRRSNSKRLSIWSAGCSTGQEVLSLAMVFAQNPSRWQGWDISILGTDVSQCVIEAATSGSYSQFEIQRGISVSRMLSFFEEAGERWVATEPLRSMTRFQVHNLLDPPPYPGEFDLILCRNVMLYFDGPTRALSFERLADALRDDGMLMLGMGETSNAQTSRFRDTDGQFSLCKPILQSRPFTEKQSQFDGQ